MVSLRRDRAALALSFILPIAFFSIFAVIFGSRRDTIPKITVVVVDEDQSRASRKLVEGLEREGSFVIKTRPRSNNKGLQPREYTAATAETAVKAGDASVALIIPHGFGDNPISFRDNQDRPTIQLLNDSSDMVAWQMVAGLLQKVAMTSMPAVMVEQGSKYADQFVGGFTPEQRKRMDAGLEQLRQLENAGGGSGEVATRNGPSSGGIIAVKTRAVVGENKNNPMVSFYAAAIGVMFLLFKASGAAGSLLDEADSRHLGSRAQFAGNHDHAVGRQTGAQHPAGVFTTSADVPLGLGGLQARFPGPYSRFRSDGPMHRFCRGSVWHAFGQHLPHACATGRPLDAGDSDYVFGRRQYVSPLPYARGDAESRTADDQRLGDRWFHQSILARRGGFAPLAAGLSTSCNWRYAVCDCSKNRAALGMRLS